MKRILLAIVAVTALTGCVSNEDPYYKIKSVSANEVTGCRQVGNLSSSSQNYGFFNGTASDKRLENAKRSAYNLSATHIVLGTPIENGNTTITEGKAYICPQ